MPSSTTATTTTTTEAAAAPAAVDTAVVSPADGLTSTIASLEDIRVDPSITMTTTTTTTTTSAATVNTANGPMSPRSYLRIHRYGDPTSTVTSQIATAETHAPVHPLEAPTLFSHGSEDLPSFPDTPDSPITPTSLSNPLQPRSHISPLQPLLPPTPFVRLDPYSLRTQSPPILRPHPVPAPHPSLWSCHNDGVRNSCCEMHCLTCRHGRCERCFLWPDKLLKKHVEKEEREGREAVDRTEETRAMLNFIFPQKAVRVWEEDRREMRWAEEERTMRGGVRGSRFKGEGEGRRSGRWITREAAAGWERARGSRFSEVVREMRRVPAEDAVSEGASGSRFTDDEESVVDSLSRVSLNVEPSEASSGDEREIYGTGHVVNWNDPEADSEPDAQVHMRRPIHRPAQFDHADWDDEPEVSVNTRIPGHRRREVDVDREEPQRRVVPALPLILPGRERRGAVDLGGSRETSG